MHEGSAVVKDFYQKLQAAIRLERFDNLEHLLQRLDLIQELPHLIDPYVQTIFDHIGPLLVASLRTGQASDFIHDLYCVIYHLTKLRGAKTISTSSCIRD